MKYLAKSGDRSVCRRVLGVLALSVLCVSGSVMAQDETKPPVDASAGVASAPPEPSSAPVVPATGDNAPAVPTDPTAPVTAPEAPTTVYRKVDRHGNVTFSDQPEDGEAVDVLPANTVPPHVPIPRAPEQAAMEKQVYKKCAVVAPTSGETMGQEVTSVTLSAATEPGLFSGHTLQFMANGNPLGAAGTAMNYVMAQYDRGTYAITVKVLDAEGKTVCVSKPVEFHVKRASLLFPKPDSNNPKPVQPLPGAGAGSSGGAGSTGGAGSAGGTGSTGGAGSAGGASSAGGVGIPAKTTPAPK